MNPRFTFKSFQILAGLVLALTTPVWAAVPFGDLPLYFTADSPARFQARGCDSQFSVSPTSARLTLQKSGSTRTVEMRFSGANPAAEIQGDGLMPGKINYLTGSSPAQWRTGISLFSQVRVQEIYPGIDLVYYGNGTQLEYDFTVAAEANPDVINIRFSGADRISINPQGELVLQLGDSTILQPKPVIYQNVDGQRKAIAGGYKITGPHEVAFAVSSYNHSLPLVIDPVMSYSTYFGGTLGDVAWAVAVNPNDDSVYVAGQTLSKIAMKKGPPFSTPGAFQEDYAGGKYTGDGFVARFDDTGTNLIFLTYLGGSSDDFVSGLTLNAAGDVFLTGFTSSSNFPTVNALSPTNNGVYSKKYKGIPGDVFVAELDPSGSNLIFSTYLGGSALDAAYGIALDSAENIYLTGLTRSTNYPVVNPLAYQLVGSTNLLLDRLAGTNNAFVTELGAGGSPVIFSTYLGGNIYDVGEGITVDPAGNILVTGFTSSTNFPTLNAVSTLLNQRVPKKNDKFFPYDAFVAKLAPAGAGLVYSTYLGSTNNDVAFKIASDSAGNAYVTGYTGSPAFPNTVTNIPGFYAHGGKKNTSDNDAFLTKFDPSGAIVYSAVFGGKSADQGYGVALDAIGDVFVVGYTSSKDFPTNNTYNTLGLLRAKNKGDNDVFVTVFNPTATALLYSGYLGGKSNDYGYGISVDPAGNAYLVGRTDSKDFTLTNAFQPFRNGKYDSFLTKIPLVP